MLFSQMLLIEVLTQLNARFLAFDEQPYHALLSDREFKNEISFHLQNQG